MVILYAYLEEKLLQIIIDIQCSDVIKKMGDQALIVWMYERHADD